MPASSRLSSQKVPSLAMWLFIRSIYINCAIHCPHNSPSGRTSQCAMPSVTMPDTACRCPISYIRHQSSRVSPVMSYPGSSGSSPHNPCLKKWKKSSSSRPIFSISLVFSAPIRLILAPINCGTFQLIFISFAGTPRKPCALYMPTSSFHICFRLALSVDKPPIRILTMYLFRYSTRKSASYRYRTSRSVSAAIL